MSSFQIFHDDKCRYKATSNSYRARVDLARNSADSSFGVSFSVEDMDEFENVIPDNFTESGECKMVLSWFQKISKNPPKSPKNRILHSSPCQPQLY